MPAVPLLPWQRWKNYTNVFCLLSTYPVHAAHVCVCVCVCVHTALYLLGMHNITAGVQPPTHSAKSSKICNVFMYVHIYVWCLQS